MILVRRDLSVSTSLCVTVTAFLGLVMCSAAVAQSTGKEAPTPGKADNGNRPASGKTRGEPVEPKFAWVNRPTAALPPRVSHRTFMSPSLKTEVGYCIYLPVAYDSGTARFPVVYYLHGGRPGSELKSVKQATYLHNYMQAGQLPPMIYVFVNGGPVSHYNIPGEPAQQGADVFIHELIPHIDATWRTVADREHRGLEGFSQGGRGTARLAFRYPELFCSAAPGGAGQETERKISESNGRENENLVFAPGDNTYDLARAYAQSAAPRVKLQVHVGTKCFNYENNLAYMEFLKSLEIPFEQVIVIDAGHSAAQVYEARGLEIASFHARNFGLMR